MHSLRHQWGLLTSPLARAALVAEVARHASLPAPPRLCAPMGEVTAAAQAAGSLHALSGLVVHYQAALSATVAVACFSSLGRLWPLGAALICRL